MWLWQGGFVEAASPAPATLQLASAVLELAINRQVASHAQAFVRRCALVTCSQVCHDRRLAWPGVVATLNPDHTPRLSPWHPTEVSHLTLFQESASEHAATIPRPAAAAVVLHAGMAYDQGCRSCASRLRTHRCECCPA